MLYRLPEPSFGSVLMTFPSQTLRLSLLLLYGLMINRPVEPRWGSPNYVRFNPAFHAGLLSFNPFGIVCMQYFLW
jgi:hypothetical protein